MTCLKLVPVVLAAPLLFTNGCTRRAITARPNAGQARNDSFLDLTPGGRLRIVMPVLKPGTSSVVTGQGTQNGNTIVLSATNLLGYSSSYYAIEGRSKNRIKLRFALEEVTKDGVTKTETEPPQLPFALPQKTGHIRLIYLLRSSVSDHNMAIVAAAKQELLSTFTEQVQADPSRCAVTKQIFCFVGARGNCSQAGVASTIELTGLIHSRTATVKQLQKRFGVLLT